jgi:hypothetical protein
MRVAPDAQTQATLLRMMRMQPQTPIGGCLPPFDFAQAWIDDFVRMIERAAEASDAA